MEGVERIGEVDALRSAGARFMQGFYFARPKFEALTHESAMDWKAILPEPPGRSPR